MGRWALVLARGVLCVAFARALYAQQPMPGGARVVPRASLPQAFLAALDSGKLRVVGGKRVTPVEARASAVRLQPGEVLVTRVGTSAVLVPGHAAGAPAESNVRPPVGRPRPMRPPPEGEKAPSPSPPPSPPPRPRTGPPTVSRYVLPYRILVADASGGAPLVLRPVYQAARELRYDPTAKLYVGSFFLGLEDSTASTSVPLHTTILFQFAAPDVDSLVPDNVSIDHTNGPLVEVVAHASHVRDSLALTIVPSATLQGIAVWLLVGPSLYIDTLPGAIQGFGVESTPITIALRGQSIHTNVPITISASHGSVIPRDTMIDSMSRVTVTLRSQGQGQDTIQVDAPTIGMSATAAIKYGWPIPFFVAAFMGGVLGSLIGWLRGRRGSVVRRVTLGVLVGVLVALAYYAIGLNLLKLAITVRFVNEAAVFTLAALGALLGIAPLGDLDKPQT